MWLVVETISSYDGKKIANVVKAINGTGLSGLVMPFGDIVEITPYETKKDAKQVAEDINLNR